MPKGYPALSHDQKEEIIKRIKEKGERVAVLAQEYGVDPKTIYNSLRGTATRSGTLLEIAKLKREKDALLKIIGELVAEKQLGKKNKDGR